MLPQHLVEEFWLQVTAILQNDHGLSKSTATKWVSMFRPIAADRLGDVTFSRGPEFIAEIVADAERRGGFAEPAQPLS